MLEKIPDPDNYVSKKIDFIEDLYYEWIIDISEVNKWIRLVHNVAKIRNIVDLTLENR